MNILNLSYIVVVQHRLVRVSVTRWIILGIAYIQNYNNYNEYVQYSKTCACKRLRVIDLLSLHTNKVTGLVYGASHVQFVIS